MISESYNDYCENFRQELDEVVVGESFEMDTNVLTGGRYGRVPGSTNTKNDAKVRFVGTIDGDILTDTFDLLQAREVVKVEKIHTPVLGETTEKWEDSIL